MAATDLSSAQADGRTARAARTRDSVVEALLGLIDDGNLRPTAREIADRAGVSLRSVYVHFEDLEDLFAAAARRQFERILPLLGPVPTEGGLPARLSAFVEHRARLLEAGSNVRRAAMLQEPFSPALSEIAGIVRKAARDEIERVFAAELSQRRGPARRRLLLALDVAASAPVWEQLRFHGDVDEARAVVTTMLTALLAGE